MEDILLDLLIPDVVETLKVVPDPNDGALVQCDPVLLPTVHRDVHHVFFY